MQSQQHELQILGYIDSAIKTVKTQPLLLGGRPGGYIGQLNQTRIQYDISEAEIYTVPESGISLMDNLNRIRYRLAAVEAGVPSGSFINLVDTPSTYIGNAGKSVIVNEGEDGVEFFTYSGIPLVDKFTDLSDAPQTYEGNAYQIIAVNSTEDGLTFLPPPNISFDGGFTDLVDVPASYSGAAGLSVTVNGTEDGLEFTTVSGGVGNIAFTDLTDAPTFYEGYPRWLVAVTPTEDRLEFISPRTGYDVWDAMMAPTNSNNMDDEFNDLTLDGKWTLFDQSTESTISELINGLHMKTSGSNVCAIYQSIPSGDFTAWTKIYNLGNIGTVQGNGLFLGADLVDNPTTSQWLLVSTRIDQYSTDTLNAQVYTNYQTPDDLQILIDNTFSEILSGGTFIRFRYDAILTETKVDLSVDGIEWKEMFTFSAFAPKQVGLFTVNTSTADAIFPFFRVTDSKDQFQVMYGNR